MSWKFSVDQKRSLILLFLQMPFFILSSFLVANSLDLPNSDFFTFWLAGRMTLTGQNPYFSDGWIAGHHQFGATWIPNPIFPYPLPLSILTVPLGLFPLKLAYEMWVVVSELLIVLSILLFLKKWDHPKKIHFFLPLLAAAFLLRPTLVTLRDGQLGALLLFLISFAVYKWQEQRRWPAMLALSFLFIKPTIGVPVLFLVLVWLFFKKDLKTIFFLISVELIWLTAGILMDLNWISKFLANGSVKFFSTLMLFPNVWGISSQLCGNREFCVYGLGFLLGLFLVLITAYVLWSKKNLAAGSAFSLIVPVSLLLTPYIWPYDQILLLIPLFFITSLLYRRGWSYLLTALVPLFFSAFSLALLFLAIQLGQDMWSFLLPASCYGCMLWLISTQKTA